MQRPPSPIQEIEMPVLVAKKIRLLVKRDDLLHPQVSGNKWRKLKYNFLEAQSLGFQKVVTYGGAFSNHLAAVAAAGKYLGFDTFGIIRGEAHYPLNPTLQFAASCGMQFYFIPRATYRTIDRLAFAQQTFPFPFYFLPEGGTNALALQGCEEIISEVAIQLTPQLPDYYCLSVGTGGTMAGVVKGLRNKAKVIGFAALKGDFLHREVQTLLGEAAFGNWEIALDYHFGGYAKFQAELIEFINSMQRNYQLPLDPVYTGKTLFGILDYVKKDYFIPESTILMIHTGGLQGIAGFNQRFGNIID
ncbi:MAG: 1-aminocyclopropane-1-carboxylate deaminase/D-cysteine desulfhydrase [Saprospiraceae bacterium]|nr:1-aminocyclopropane-1-carboxylate deaminase/D-cysteine desulfhydrase [Saprospiraceae bacterium]